MDYIWEYGHYLRVSLDLWLIKCRGLFRGQDKTYHWQTTQTKKHPVLTYRAIILPWGKSHDRAWNRNLDLLISRQWRCHWAKRPDNNNNIWLTPQYGQLDLTVWPNNMIIITLPSLFIINFFIRSHNSDQVITQFFSQSGRSTVE